MSTIQLQTFFTIFMTFISFFKTLMALLNLSTIITTQAVVNQFLKCKWKWWFDTNQIFIFTCIVLTPEFNVLQIFRRVNEYAESSWDILNCFTIINFLSVMLSRESRFLHLIRPIGVKFKPCFFKLFFVI